MVLAYFTSFPTYPLYFFPLPPRPSLPRAHSQTKKKPLYSLVPPPVGPSSSPFRFDEDGECQYCPWNNKAPCTCSLPVGQDAIHAESVTFFAKGTNT